MIKNNKVKVAFSLLVTLLPMFVGLCFWGKIAEEHESVMRSVKIMAVFVIPAFMCLINALCIVVTHFDMKRVEQSKKIVMMALWIMPIISMYVSMIFYSILLGWDINIAFFSALIMGLLFIILGNYMPKSKQNRTFGLKICWTLANEDNWNATHRFAGKLWFFVGFAVIFIGFLPLVPLIITFFALVVAATVAPVIYSYRYYKNNVESGKQSKEDYVFKRTQQDKAIMITVCIIIGVILIGCSSLMFTGKIEASIGEDSFEIDASFHAKEIVSYSDIASVEYVTDADRGMRLMGFASARLLIGTFKNDEFGAYTRFSYTKNKDEIIITLKDTGAKIALNFETESETREFYEALEGKISE